jgi:hypothetical protein
VQLEVLEACWTVGELEMAWCLSRTGAGWMELFCIDRVDNNGRSLTSVRRLDQMSRLMDRIVWMSLGPQGLCLCLSMHELLSELLDRVFRKRPRSSARRIGVLDMM